MYGDKFLLFSMAGPFRKALGKIIQNRPIQVHGYACNTSVPSVVYGK